MRRLMKKAIIIFVVILVFFTGLSAQQDFYFDRQRGRIFFYDSDQFERILRKFSKSLTVEQACYNWFKNQQQPNGLVESYETAEVSYTYDNALAAMVYLLNNDSGRAKKVFDFFVKWAEKEVSKNGKFNGLTDMYKISGKVGNESRAIGPNAWILLALNHYALITKDRSYMEFSELIADWMLSFQDSSRGGLWGGIGEYNDKFLWMSTEHNLDCYAGFKVLSELSGKKKYLKAALEIKEFLDTHLWNENDKRFYNGWDDPNFATDVSSWAVLSLMEQKYFDSLDFAIKYSENKQFYKPNNIEITGFDFGSDYGTSPYPDKDAVWFEGTGQMVLAFYHCSLTNEADFYTDELLKGVVKSKSFDDSAGLPYASNPGSPPYGGWVMPDKPICISSTAWLIYSLKKFNPFYGNFLKPVKIEKKIEKKDEGTTLEDLLNTDEPEKKIEKEDIKKDEKKEPVIDKKKKEKIEDELFGE